MDSEELQPKQPRRKVQKSPYSSALLAKKIFLTAIFLVAQVLFIYSDYFKVKEIYIFGNSRVSDYLILKTAGIPLDQHLMTLPMGQFRQKLLTIHWVKDASLKWALPSQVKIYVQEREPVLLVRQEKSPGEWYAADIQGMVLYKAGASDLARFPRLAVTEQPQIGQGMPPDQVKAAKDMDGWVSADLKGSINHYSVDNRGEVVIIGQREGIPLQVKVGRVENMSHKMEVLGAFLEMMDQKKTRVDYIDLRSNYPVVRPFASPSPSGTAQPTDEKKKDKGE
jgi:cell division septal protein FtsQ